MLDRTILTFFRRPLQRLANTLAWKGVKADRVTWVGLAIGLLAALSITLGIFWLAILFILLNRLCDGCDGALARLGTPTDRGAFLDICFDFIFYSTIPLAFAFHNPADNALAAALLVYTFVGTGSSFLAFAILAQKRKLSSIAFPEKGFYYLGGLTEATETILIFILMCLFPNWFAVLAYFFAALCAISTALRLVHGIRAFS